MTARDIHAVLRASAIALGLSAGEGAFAGVLAQCALSHDGHVYYEDGSPAVGRSVFGYHAFGTSSGVVGADARYGLCVPYFGTSTTVAPGQVPGLHSVPASRSCGYNGSCNGSFGMDFTLIRHVVTGQIVDPTGTWSVAGIEIEAEGEVVAVTDAQGRFAFRPLQVGVPVVGEGRARHSFMAFVPSILQYNVGTGDFAIGQVEVFANVDPAAAVASWEVQNGAGWDYFPLDPRDIFPHNPNVYVTLDLDDASFSTPIPADRLRMVSDPVGILPEGGVVASADATSANGYAVQFTHPIGPCGRANLSIQVGLTLASGGVYWLPIETIASGTSRSDLTGDGNVNLADVGVFSGAYGKSEGQPGFNPCCDYFPDGVIDLTDSATFSTALTWQASLTGPPPDLEPEGSRTPRRLADRLRISPNPAPGRVELSIELDESTPVRMTVHDVSGRLVRRVVERVLSAGRHGFAWDGADEHGESVRGGIYFVSVHAGTESATRRLVRLD